MVAHIELIDTGSTVNAYEDKEHGRILAMLFKPRPQSSEPYVITVPRTGFRIERHSAGLAYAAHKRLAFDEYHSLNPTE